MQAGDAVLGYDIAHSTLFSEEGFDRTTIRLPTDVILVKKGPTPKFDDDSFHGEAGKSGSVRDEDEESVGANLGDLIQTAQIESFYQKSRGRVEEVHVEEEGKDCEDDEEIEAGEEKLPVDLIGEEVEAVMTSGGG